jgi:hypothetical protein
MEEEEEMNMVEMYKRYDDIKIEIFKLQKEWGLLSVVKRMEREEKNNRDMNILYGEEVRDELAGSRVDILA